MAITPPRTTSNRRTWAFYGFLVAMVVGVIAVLFWTVTRGTVEDTSADAGADEEPLPATQTPEYLRSQQDCSAGLAELVVEPVWVNPALLGEQSPVLTPFLGLGNVTVLAFDRGSQASDSATGDSRAASAEPGLNGFVGSRDGKVWAFAVPSGALPGGEAGTNQFFGGEAVLSAEPLIDLSHDTAAEHDQGLLGMAIGPQGEWLYLNRTAGNGDSVITAHAIQPASTTSPGNTIKEALATVGLGEAVEMLVVEQPNPQHNGGDIVFGPQGYMYVSFGDGGGLGDPFKNSQDTSTLLGSILRLQVDPAKPSGERAVAAAGNPYLDGNDGRGGTADPRTWVSGVRNPYRMTYDVASDRLWVADVGQRCVEEFNALRLDEGGADLGWNVFEGSMPFLGEPVRPHRSPDFEYGRRAGLCAVVGGQVYSGQVFAGLSGWFVWADLCDGRLLAFDPGDFSDGSSPDSTRLLPNSRVDNSGTGDLHVVDLGVSAERIVGVTKDPLGELYVIDLANGVFRLSSGT